MNAPCHSHPIWPGACAALTAALRLTASQPPAAQPGWILPHQKISATDGGFSGIPDDADTFGVLAASPAFSVQQCETPAPVTAPPQAGGWKIINKSVPYTG